MIRPSDATEAARFRESLRSFEVHEEPLRGLTGQSRDVFVAQLVESQRRVQYLRTIRDRIDRYVHDPQLTSFDPIKGAVLNNRMGDFDEACWLVFLAVHFGRHHRDKWALSRAFYGRLGQGDLWTWQNVSANPEAAIDWLQTNEAAIRKLGLRFGNHRKYQSITAHGPKSTGIAIATYADWIKTSHAQRFSEATAAAGSPPARFSALYDSLKSVAQFGRTARFDNLALLSRLELYDVEADSMHLGGSTGPLKGARLLLTGTADAKLGALQLEAKLAPLCKLLEVSFDILEDALCNWQKRPNSFLPFRG